MPFDKSLVQNVIKSAIENDFEFFENDFSKLVDQDLLKKVSDILKIVNDNVYSVFDTESEFAPNVSKRIS